MTKSITYFLKKISNNLILKGILKKYKISLKDKNRIYWKPNVGFLIYKDKSEMQINNRRRRTKKP